MARNNSKIKVSFPNWLVPKEEKTWMTNVVGSGCGCNKDKQAKIKEQSEAQSELKNKKFFL